MRPEVLAYYRRMGERSRLSTGRGRLEFLRTWDVLTRVLPTPPASVLDVGGATGAYAGPLARAGYAVHVVDPVPEQVATAAALPGVTATVGDARALAEPDATVDAVLLLGPLYHLVERSDRVAAWREAARVLRPGGVVVAASISRYASLIDGYASGFQAEPRFPPLVRRVLDTGRHEPPGDDDRWFTTSYFHRPDELPDEVAAAGLVLDRLVAVEGPVWMIERLDAVLDDDDQTGLLLDQLRAVESEPAIMGASSHVLAVGRVPAEPPEHSIRAMRPSDAEQVLAIYQAGMDTGNATYQTVAPSWEEWDAGHLPAHRHVAVDPADGRLLGWVALSPVSRRPVYAGVAEHSVYIRPDAQGRGVGRALLHALIASSEAAGIWTIVTAIFPENETSLALHRSVGFRLVGRRERLARHHGAWRDVLMLERRSPTVT